MGNCLSTCTRRSESTPQDTEEEGCLQTIPPGLEPQVIEEEEAAKSLVQQELQALQDQISHSQAVLAKLNFRFNDETSHGSKSELAKVHRTTQTSSPDNLPKSLECVAVSSSPAINWSQITSSCPAIVSTASQTDDDDTTSKSNGTSGEYFLPPISPRESQTSEPASPKELDDYPSKSFEPRAVGHIDLDIYRSCRKLSVLPEEECVPEEVSPRASGVVRLAPTHPPHHQAHSFESYLLPVPEGEGGGGESCVAGVRRQLSDPTPSPTIHPVSRRSSRSTCRPLQLEPEVFHFPEVKSPSPQRPKSPPFVKFQTADDFEDDFPRITSPTYNILQDTVSQLITMSSESVGAPENLCKKESLTIPSYYNFTPDGSTPFKTPPETLMGTPIGFQTTHDLYDRKLADSSTSSSFQTPSSASPGTNGAIAEMSKSSSNSDHSFKTLPLEVGSDGTPYQSSFNSPLPMSPNKRRPATNKSNENAFTEVPHLSSVHASALYVKPLPSEFDQNRTMLSIFLDEQRVQNDNKRGGDEPVAPIISFTCLDLGPPAGVPVPSPSTTAFGSPVAPDGLARTPSRRRLQRSLVRISSETPLELVPVDLRANSCSAEAAVTASPPLQDCPTLNGEEVPIEHVSDNKDNAEEDCKMRQVATDSGASGPVSPSPTAPPLLAPTPAASAFPTLSDTVLRQLGALMEEVKSKEEAPSTEKDIENKFTSLMLAFKTDKLTLERRLERQMRLRDQAERNMADELTRLKAAVQLLSPLCTDSEKIELLEKVSEQVDALHKSTTRVSTSAEMYGAVQQENRLSKAVDIVLRHVENLKQAYDKEKTDHDETRKVLSDNKVPSTALLKLQSSKRRASIATVPRGQMTPDPSRSPVLPAEGRSVSRTRLASLPRKLSNTILEAESEDTATPSDPVPNTGSSQQREAAEGTGSVPQTPTRTLTRKTSRPSVSEDRELNQQAESDSEDESSALQPARELSPPSTHNTLSNSPRRLSVRMAWLTKIAEQVEWPHPVDQLVVHLRYFVAAILLLAALVVFTATIILPHTLPS